MEKKIKAVKNRVTPRKRLKDPDHAKKPSLRISNIVYGREKLGTRVFYLADQKGGGTKKYIAERVVLYRWKKRIFEGYNFYGSRLNPKIWRILVRIFGSDPKAWIKLSIEDIQQQLDLQKASIRERFERLPDPRTIYALFEVCGISRLQKIIDRHNDPERRDCYGTPDLFLYAIEKQSSRATIARFVEVKKPEETVKPDQHEEINFLQSLGLHARILRLDERD